MTEALGDAGSGAADGCCVHNDKRRHGSKPQASRRTRRKQTAALGNLCEMLRRVQQLRAAPGSAQQCLLMIGASMRRPRNALLVTFHPCACPLPTQPCCDAGARAAQHASALRLHAVSMLAAGDTCSANGGARGKLAVFTTLGGDAHTVEQEHFAPKLKKCAVAGLHFSVTLEGTVVAACTCADRGAGHLLGSQTWRTLGEPVRCMSLLAQGRSE